VLCLVTGSGRECVGWPCFPLSQGASECLARKGNVLDKQTGNHWEWEDTGNGDWRIGRKGTKIKVVRQFEFREERGYTDLTSRLLESRFFLDLGVEHHGCSMGEEGEKHLGMAGSSTVLNGGRWKIGHGWVGEQPADCPPTAREPASSPLIPNLHSCISSTPRPRPSMTVSVQPWRVAWPPGRSGNGKVVDRTRLWTTYPLLLGRQCPVSPVPSNVGCFSRGHRSWLSDELLINVDALKPACMPDICQQAHRPPLFSPPSICRPPKFDETTSQFQPARGMGGMVKSASS
jgi:hypothetical protein